LAVDFTRRRRFGPAPLDATDKRVHTVSARLNGDELALLDARRGPLRMRRGEYLRAAAFGKLPPSIPEVNRQAWSELARTASNLNQLARHLNMGQRDDLGLGLGLSDQIAECLRLLSQVRRGLIGAKEDDDEGEG
jgi:hypothetical protein